MIDNEKLAEFTLQPELALQNLDQLLGLLDSEDESEVNSASDLLENCGAPGISDVPLLCEQLRSGRSSKVYWCSTLVGRLGPTIADEFVRSRMHSDLCRAISNESLNLSSRERAAWAIGELGRVDSNCRAVLKIQVEKAPPRLKRLLETALAT